ncbi:MAG TPA: Calx-beta domain-containing protein [Thermoanaerobaculia bacterium]|jgi:predicted outer membrane repeat protein|nr:Calx-beta domain-containing protein [Thermoanaerobaculia bacterium]
MTSKRRSSSAGPIKPSPVSSAALAAGTIGLAALASPAAQAATFTVTNLNDGGAGSLRDAISTANSTAGADVINFQPGLTGTITLTTGQLVITDSVDIQGPGAADLSVSGNDSSRVFYLYSSPLLLTVAISDLTVRDGAASNGAGIVNFNENLTLDGVVVTENNATGDGGGLWMDGFDFSFTIRNSTFSGNTAGSTGGGIYVEDTNDDGIPNLIQDTTISGNSANRGGGIYFYDPDSPITIDRTTIADNIASVDGGGLTLVDTDTTGAFVISNSTISGNSAPLGGGAYFYQPDNPVTLRNVTVSDNHATAGSGGGLFFYGAYSTVNLEFVTIVSNDATSSGGGVYVENGTVDLMNSIVANNTAPSAADLAGAGTFDVTWSLIEASGGNVTDGGNNITGTDPDLGPLADNGGPTETHLPNVGSPVIDSANLALTPGLTTDQRGVTRPAGTAADIGAVEVDGGTIAFDSPTYTVNEVDGTVTVTVTRTGGTDPAEIDYTTAPGTATAGSDYTTTAGTITFATGQISQSIIIPILDDATLEGPETFTVTLSTPESATLGVPSTTTVTINDLEDVQNGTVQFSSPTYTVDEDGGVLTVTVTRTGGSDGSVSVNYSTSSGTATSGADFTPTSGTITFLAGDSAPKTFNVPILLDALTEGPENFVLTLDTPTGGATLGATPTAVATINDATIAPAQVPIFGPLGRLLLIMSTTAIGLFMTMRKRLFGFLFVILLAGLTSDSLFAAKAPVTPAGTRAEANAAARGHEKKAEKTRGVIASVTTTTEGTVITFEDNSSVNLGNTASLVVRDLRTANRAKASVAALRVGQTVAIRVAKKKSDGGKTVIRILQ